MPVSIANLQAARERFGGFTFLDYRALSLIEAHHQLGKHVCQQVHKVLGRRMGELNEADLSRMLRQARDSRHSLEQRAHDPVLPQLMRSTLYEYLDCLGAWTEGCRLAEFQHARLEGVSAFDRALLLQYEESGCQTGVYRQSDGSVILWHTEEDVEQVPGDGFDELRLACFQVEGGHGPADIYAFIYPDLLPGPAFGWRSDGYAQAVDTLHTHPYDGPLCGTLANSACWLTLRLGAAMEVGEVLKLTSPFYTGYALNTIYRENDRVAAHKYEFAGDQLAAYQLSDQPGSYLFQANIFSDPQGQAARTMECLSIENWRKYRQRVYRTRRFMKEKLNEHSPDGDMGFLLKMMGSRAGGDWAYANPSVKAHFLQQLSAEASETWLGYGPAQSELETVLKF